MGKFVFEKVQIIHEHMKQLNLKNLIFTSSDGAKANEIFIKLMQKYVDQKETSEIKFWVHLYDFSIIIKPKTISTFNQEP